MPVSLAIEESGHLIHYVFSNPWEIAEVEATFKQDIAHRDSVAFTVHSLLDIGKGHDIPIGALRLRSTPAINHPRKGYMVMVGVTPLILALSDTVFRITHTEKVKTFATEDQALAFLRQVIEEETNSPA